MDDGLRLPSGGLIDRDKPITFRFNNRDYQGFEGDTLASALLAAGVRLTARSFKFHRPRGVTSAGVDEPSSIVELLGPEQSGNHPITKVALRHGLVARSVNCWPSANFDVMSVNQWFSRLLPAAFYYKTFMWPSWHMWEPGIRRLAGLARAPVTTPAAGSYETRYGHCDVLVVGAGPAGLMAALVAGRAGCRVMLVDEGAEPGGRLLDHRSRIDGISGGDWVAGVVAELDSRLNVRRLPSTSVWAYREGNLLIMTQRHPERTGLVQRTWRVRAKQVVLATGANERPLVFPDNDRPGIMLASAAQTYLHRYAV
ncbi:MAG: FAD-dependent oxidoreductase, partial [Rhodoferax sp.]|nr:FAD-dependent oxidoreductase [Rhodoferax sp.]